MSYITLKNDRKRRRQARQVTFLITATVMIGLLYAMGAGEQLADLYQQWFGAAPTPVAVA